jgi:hypothetical protein
MTPREVVWAAVVERLLRDDRLALAELARLVNSWLVRWNAYDVRDDWDDAIREVVLSAARAWREGRIREREALPAHIRSVAQLELCDRDRTHATRSEDATRTRNRSETHPAERELLAYQAAPGAIEPGRRAALEAHVACCAACRSELRAIEGFDFAAFDGALRG